MFSRLAETATRDGGRDCWHMVKGFALPKLHKKIIYLDQYVVSNLMKLDNPELQRNRQSENEPVLAVECPA